MIKEKKFVLLILFVAYLLVILPTQISAEQTLINLNLNGVSYGQEIIWKSNATGPFDEQSTALAVNGTIYLVSRGYKQISALNASDGKSIWNFSTGSDQLWDGPIYENGVIYSGGGGVYALNATTGVKIWGSPDVTHSYSQVATYAGSPYVAANSGYDGSVAVFNKTNGAEIWNVTYPYAKGAPSPVMYGDYLLIAYTYTQGSHTDYLVAYNVTNGSIIWAANTGNYWDSTPVIKNGIVYAAQSPLAYLRAFYLSNGSEIWNATMQGGSLSTPSFHEGILYISPGAFGTVLDAYNATNGSLIWTYNDPSAIYGSPTLTMYSYSQPSISNGMIFFTRQDQSSGRGSYIYALNETNGNFIWRYFINKTLYGFTSLADGNLYVISDDWNVYAFDLGTGSGNWTMPDYDSNRTGFCSDCLTSWQKAVSSCSYNGYNTTCTITNDYDHNLSDVTLDTGNLKFNWYGSSGTLLKSNSNNYTLGLASSASSNVTLVASGASGCTQINAPGSYLLDSDILGSWNSVCFNVTTSNVSLDCQGHTVSGTYNQGYAIYSRRSSYIPTNITIKNCNISDWGYGVYFYYSDNNTIEDTILNHNRNYGAYMYYSRYNLLDNISAENNNVGVFGLYVLQSILRNSKIINSNLFGLDWEASSSSLFYNNLFNNSKNYISSAYVNSWNTTKQSADGRNIFNSSFPQIGGNYWGYPNGTGFSDTCTDANKDGICDQQYSPSSHNFDYLPLSSTADSTSPSITILSPENLNYSSNSIGFNVSSNENLSLCNFTFDDWQTNYSMTLNSSLTGANYSNSSMADGKYDARFWCEDAAGNMNNSLEVNFSVDTVKPVATVSCSSQSVSAGSSFPCSCSGTDATSGVQTATGSSNSPDGISTPETAGSYTYTCNVTDWAGNSNSSTETYTVTSVSSSSEEGSSSGAQGYSPNYYSHDSSSTVLALNKTLFQKGNVSIATFNGFDPEVAVNQIVIYSNGNLSDFNLGAANVSDLSSGIRLNSSKIYQYFYINTSSGNLPYNATMTIKVNNTWLSINGIDKTDVSLFKTENLSQAWKEINLSYVSGDENYSYYEVNVSSFSYFAIAEKSFEVIPESGSGLFGRIFFGLMDKAHGIFERYKGLILKYNVIEWMKRLFRWN